MAKKFMVGLRIEEPCRVGSNYRARLKVRGKVKDYLMAIGVDGSYHYEEILAGGGGARIVAEAHFPSRVTLSGLQKKATKANLDPELLRQLVN